MINKSLISHTDDVLADESAPESEYDSKSLKRKKRQNKIRRWAMDKLVKRGGAKEGTTSGKESPSLGPDGDDSSVASKDSLAVRTLPLRERKSTFSSGELPPPKPPRSRKAKSTIMETSVTEPLLSTEEPASEEWYKSGSLFETDDFCDSIMEVIKNIGYTCESPPNMLLSDEVSCDTPVQSGNNKCEEEVIANGNVLVSNSPLGKTLTPPTVEIQDVTNNNQDVANSNQDVVNDSQNVTNGNQDVASSNQDVASSNQDVASGNQDVASGNQNVGNDSQDVTNGNQDVASSNQDVTNGNQPNDHVDEEIPDEFQCYNGDDKMSTESPQEELPSSFVTRHLREKSVSASDVSLEFFSAHSSPVNINDNCELPIPDQTKPARKLETVTWTSEDSSSATPSITNIPQESPPSSKASTTNVSPLASTSDGHIVTQTSEKIPTSISIEISEATGGVSKDSELSSTPGEQDTGPSYTIIKSQTDADVNSSTVVEGGIMVEENSEVTSSVNDNAKISSGTASPVTASTLLLPDAATGDPFTSDDELDDNGRPVSTLEPIIIPLSKSAHEVNNTEILHNAFLVDRASNCRMFY